MHDDVLSILVLIGLIALLSQWAAWRLRIPAILFLLAGGLILGPTTGLLDPDKLFGELLFPFVSLAVAAILFEGSLTLKKTEIEGHGSVVRNLVTVGPLITWAVVACVTHWFIGADWPLAFLFGSIMTVTGPTVIAPMLRAVRPTSKIANILRWEGILIDPVGAILAVLTFNVIVAQQGGSAIDDTIVLLMKLTGVGLAMGSLSGYTWGLVLRNYLVPGYLQSVFTLLIVFGVYLAADLLEHEAGLLAVTVMGVWLANMRDVHMDEILDFKESLSVLLISGLFVLLAARIDFDQLAAVGWPALLVLIALQFVARPAKVFVCSAGSDLTIKEKTLLAWIGPRGIIAAAISALFALRLESFGIEDAKFIVPLSFAVIAGTVILQSITARPLASALGLANPDPEGLLIIGSNPFALAFAAVLKENGFRVIISGSSWQTLRKARMAGLEIYYGNPLSNHAEQNMDLTGIGKVFGLSTNAAFNDLVCTYFADEFGRQHAYSLPLDLPDESSSKEMRLTNDVLRGQHLFSKDMSIRLLSEYVRNGGEIRTTRLTEEYNFETFRQEHGDSRIPLAAWNDAGRLRIFTADAGWKPDAGWTLVALLKRDAAPAVNGNQMANL